MTRGEIELPVDPEQGLTAAAISALHELTLMPENHDERYDRLSAVLAWVEFMSDEEIVRDAVLDLVALQAADGTIVVRPATRRAKRLPVVLELPATVQREILETANPTSPDQSVIVALMCIEEIVSELLGVHAHPEQMYGHLALVHGKITDTAATHKERSSEHRVAHLVDGVFVGHTTSVRPGEMGTPRAAPN